MVLNVVFVGKSESTSLAYEAEVLYFLKNVDTETFTQRLIEKKWICNIAYPENL